MRGSCGIYKIKQIPKIDIYIQCLWNKDEISPTPSFSCFFFLNIRNTRCLFGIYFILHFLKLSWFL